MPKTRASGTIAGTNSDSNIGYSDGGTNDNDLLEMARRLSERISNTTTIDVLTHSDSRNRQERLQVTIDPAATGRAVVLSESGRTYEVDYENESCNCMDHRIRGRRCRHIAAAHQALGDVMEHSQSNRAITGSSSLLTERIEQEVVNSDRAEEDERGLQREFYDDETFYTEMGEGEFDELLERSREQQLPYEYDNVLNGSQNTFGIELEFVGGNADAIAQELYSLGICAFNHRVGYHSESVPGKWKLERDGTVSDGASGGELVSPILKDTPETWSTIEKICEVAKRHGATIDQRCGGHIHFGITPLDTARQRWRRFFRSVGSFEDIIYRLSGGNLGQIRSNYSRYATPFSEQARRTARSRFSLNDRNDIDQLAQRASNQSRYYGVNLTNIYRENRPNTVEFRYFNGSLDPGQIQANVKIANGFLTAAEKARTKSTETSPSTESMKKRGNLLQEHFIDGDSRTNHTGIKRFLDIMFTRKTDKDTVLSVYAKNRWAT